MNEAPNPTTMQRDSTSGVADTDEISVLVVDDEEAVADLYWEMLAERYHVETAYGGEQALDAVDERFDVVLLDRQMPDRSGDDVLDELRRRNVDCRVAMVTAVEPDVDIVDMEFDDYVVKPVASDGLFETVERLRMVSEYRDLQLELSSKRVKRNVLRTEMARPELADSEEFQRLESRIRELESVLTTIETELDDGYLVTPNVA